MILVVQAFNEFKKNIGSIYVHTCAYLYNISSINFASLLWILREKPALYTKWLLLGLSLP